MRPHAGTATLDVVEHGEAPTRRIVTAGRILRAIDARARSRMRVRHDH
jgi:hypothetical protein